MSSSTISDKPQTNYMNQSLQKLLLVMLTAFAAITASAIPAKSGLEILAKQSDGSTVTLHLIGDEYFHTYTTTDGAAVSQAADGNFYYRTADGISTVMAHNVSSRSASEASFVAANLENMNVAAVAKAARKSGAMRARQAGPARVGSQVPVTDSPKIPVLLVQYSDVKFKDSDPKATFESFFAEGSTSAYQYFVDQSNGKYSPQFDIYGPVTLSGNRATYGGNDSEGYDIGVGTMVGEACNSLNSSIDFSQYDNDGDGECDVVIVLYAGVGEASSSVKDSVWPCQWDLASSDYGKNLTLDKTKVSKFAVFNELNGSNTSMIDGIGTFCHEFSHCMGLPDFYDTNYSGYFGMGPWSLMDYGSYNNDGYTPLGYSAYEKEFMGWITIEEGTANTQYTLPIFNQKSEDTDKAIKITSDYDSNEYYILENRAKQGWDKYMYAEGMMITHVTYKASYWTNNTVNDYSTQCMTIIPADNSLAMSGSYIVESSLAGDLWPYNGKTELTNTSTPAAKVNTGTYMSKPITEITKNSDGTVSFWVMKAATPAVATPTALSASVEGETSATISWEPGDDTDVTYTLEVKEYQEPTITLVGEYDFTNGSYNNWSKSNSTDVDTTNGVKLASSNKSGSITSPSFTTDDSGDVTVKFTAKKYNNDNGTLTVSLSTGAKTTVSLTSEYAEYSVVLSGTANTSTKVTFNAASKNRCYIKNATIYTGSDTEKSDSRVVETVTNKTRTFVGITDTSYQVTDLEAGTLYKYRVKALPTDTESYTESAWTAYNEFTTDGGDENGGDENGEENGGNENGDEDVTTVTTPTDTTVDLPEATSATIAWEAADNTDVTYTLELTKETPAPDYELVGEYSFASGKGSWTTSGYTINESGSMRLGSGKQLGSLTSPGFKTDETGVVTLIFSAKNYGTDNSNLKVSIDGTDAAETVTLSDAFKTYCVVLNAPASTLSTKVVISTISTGLRAYVQSASIYTGDASSLAASAPAKVEDKTEGNVRTISGITETSYTVTDLEENTTYSYRIKTVPNDTENYKESDWSEPKSFTTSVATAIDSIDADADASDADAAYYTLGGLRLTGAPTAPGLYIRRTATRVTKHVVK
jgi:M6 family metalloprotease-like protein